MSLSNTLKHGHQTNALRIQRAVVSCPAEPARTDCGKWNAPEIFCFPCAGDGFLAAGLRIAPNGMAAAFPGLERSHVAEDDRAMPGVSCQPPEFVRGHACVAGNAAHCVRVYRICPRNNQPRFTIGHDDMAALPDDAIAEFLKYANGVLMSDTWKFRHIKP